MTHQDDDPDFRIALGNTGVICLTVAFVVLVVVSFGSCLYHRESQADRRLQCVELTRDAVQCSKSFPGGL